MNRTGGGAVGHTAGATADPDGHTITIVTVEIAMIHWMGLAQVTPRDFAPAAQLNFDPASVQVKADAPLMTIAIWVVPLVVRRRNAGRPTPAGG